MDDYAREIESLRGIIGKYFPVYETRIKGEAFAFHVNVDRATLYEKFDELRKELLANQYIPLITQEMGEQIIYVQRRPTQGYTGTYVNLALIIVTFFTTLIAGMGNWAAYSGASFFSPSTVLWGALYFSLPLMAILGIHEMGHYVMARKYRVHASLPFFLPSIPPLGTFGAVISMRDPIPDRKALLDIGISGPILGFLVAIPVVLGGIYLMNVDPRPVPVNLGGEVIVWGLPLLYQLLLVMFPTPGDVLFHPMAFAGWVGLFVTALNLLPAGQLDGGHVSRALLGDKARYVSYGTVLFLLLLFLWELVSDSGNFSWLLMAFLIVLLGARHPPPLNDLSPLPFNRKLLGLLAALILVATFVPQPSQVIHPSPDFEFVDPTNETDLYTKGEIPLNATAGNRTSFQYSIQNTGNVLLRVNSSFGSGVLNLANWTVRFNRSGVLGNSTVFELNSSEGKNVTVLLHPPVGSKRLEPYYIDIEGAAESTVRPPLIKKFVIAVYVR